MPYPVLKKKPSVSYVKEAIEGEHIDLYTAIDNDRKKAWFVGRHGRGTCFESCVWFEYNNAIQQT